MRFIEASQFGGPEVLVVKEKEMPAPGEGTLLIEVKAAGVNFTDMMARKGFYPPISSAPFTPGMEIAGIVKETANGVTKFKAGDTVAAILPMGGGYASHVVISASQAILFPKHLDPAVAAGLLVQGLTAYLTLDQAQVKSGEHVLIAAAAGGVGSIAVQLAKAKGATVIGLCTRPKVDFVKALGADHVVEYGSAGWAAKVAEVTGSDGIQVFLDSVGDLASEAFPLLKQSGRWIIYGLRTEHPNALPAESLPAMMSKNLTICGFSLGGNLHRVPHALEALFQLLGDASLKIGVTKYPLTEASRVHSLLEERKTIGKLVLLP